MCKGITDILNYACCVCCQTDITFLVLCKFIFAFISALLQLGDLGTDIYAIHKYAQKCHAPFDAQQFNRSVLAFKNQTSLMDDDSWTYHDVKKYLVYILDGRLGPIGLAEPKVAMWLLLRLHPTHAGPYLSFAHLCPLQSQVETEFECL